MWSLESLDNSHKLHNTGKFVIEHVDKNWEKYTKIVTYFSILNTLSIPLITLKACFYMF